MATNLSELAIALTASADGVRTGIAKASGYLMDFNKLAASVAARSAGAQVRAAQQTESAWMRATIRMKSAQSGFLTGILKFGRMIGRGFLVGTGIGAGLSLFSGIAGRAKGMEPMQKSLAHIESILDWLASLVADFVGGIASGLSKLAFVLRALSGAAGAQNGVATYGQLVGSVIEFYANALLYSAAAALNFAGVFLELAELVAKVSTILGSFGGSVLMTITTLQASVRGLLLKLPSIFAQLPYITPGGLLPPRVPGTPVPEQNPGPSTIDTVLGAAKVNAFIETPTTKILRENLRIQKRMLQELIEARRGRIWNVFV